MLKTENIEIGDDINQFADLTPSQFYKQYPADAKDPSRIPLCIYLMNIDLFCSVIIRHQTKIRDVLSHTKEILKDRNYAFIKDLLKNDLTILHHIRTILYCGYWRLQYSLKNELLKLLAQLEPNLSNKVHSSSTYFVKGEFDDINTCINALNHFLVDHRAKLGELYKRLDKFPFDEAIKGIFIKTESEISNKRKPVKKAIIKVLDEFPELKHKPTKLIDEVNNKLNSWEYENTTVGTVKTILTRLSKRNK